MLRCALESDEIFVKFPLFILLGESLVVEIEVFLDQREHFISVDGFHSDVEKSGLLHQKPLSQLFIPAVS